MAIAQGQPIGQALLGGAIQAKEIEAAMFPDKERNLMTINNQVIDFTNPDNPVPLGDYGPEKDPTKGLEILQLVGPNGNFIRNVTEQEFLDDAENWEKLGYKLTKLPTGTGPAPTGDSELVADKVFAPFKTEYDAANTLIMGLNRYADKIYKSDDLAALQTAGKFTQWIDAVIQTVDAGTNFLAAERETEQYAKYLESGGATATVDVNGNPINNGKNFDARIEQVSQEFGIQKSQVLDLAYQFAAVRGQSGRGLSDRDFENALNIISGGVGKSGKIAVIEDVAKRISEEINFKKETGTSYHKNLDNNNIVKRYNALSPLFVFTNPYSINGSETSNDQIIRIKVE
jgi:hypothetical protein